MKTPNLFNYATSELSQDAFLLWLLDWANPVYKDADAQLNAAAKKFVCLLLGKDIEISSVKCKKQMFHIDVFAVINNRYPLIIEDKTETKEHSKQIKRYRDLVNNKSKYPEPPHCVYYKSGNESMSNLNKLSTDCNIIFRKQILDTLLPFIGKTNNSIFVDYLYHIHELETITQSYLTEPAGEWKEEAWQGFYMELEKQLEMGNWGADFYKDGFSLPLCPITADEKQIQLYLYIDKYRNLCIKAKCKANCSPTNGWEGIINKIESALKSKDLVFDYVKSISDGKDIKLCDIKRLQNNKRSMFIRKTLSFSAQQPDIVNQLKELQKQLSTVTDEIKIEIK